MFDLINCSLTPCFIWSSGVKGANGDVAGTRGLWYEITDGIWCTLQLLGGFRGWTVVEWGSFSSNALTAAVKFFNVWYVSFTKSFEGSNNDASHTNNIPLWSRWSSSEKYVNTSWDISATPYMLTIFLRTWIGKDSITKTSSAKIDDLRDSNVCGREAISSPGVYDPVGFTVWMSLEEVRRTFRIKWWDVIFVYRNRNSRSYFPLLSMAVHDYHLIPTKGKQFLKSELPRNVSKCYLCWQEWSTHSEEIRTRNRNALVINVERQVYK